MREYLGDVWPYWLANSERFWRDVERQRETDRRPRRTPSSVPYVVAFQTVDEMRTAVDDTYQRERGERRYAWRSQKHLNEQAKSFAPDQPLAHLKAHATGVERGAATFCLDRSMADYYLGWLRGSSSGLPMAGAVASTVVPTVGAGASAAVAYLNRDYGRDRGRSRDACWRAWNRLYVVPGRSTLDETIHYADISPAVLTGWR